ncbi:MAG: hypothetical protein J0H94_09280 [Rhizobiales bacterium]|nr:hypothetical protein [Hyphomicrobiales bacterium]
MRRLMTFINDARTREAARQAASALGHGAAATGRAGRALGRFGIRHARAQIERRAARNQAPRMISAFDGEPETGFTRDDAGNIMAVVRPRVLTPRRAKIADALGPLTSFTLWSLSLLTVAAIPHAHFAVWGAAAIIPWAMKPLFQSHWRRKLRLQSTLVFTESHLVVRSGRGAPRIFDRENAHRFRLETRHAAAESETEAHEIAIERARLARKVSRPRKYYRDTLHLMIEHERYPRFVMEIMGREDAVRVLGRINQVEAHMERIAAMGAIPTGGPQLEWDDMPGKIPEKV